MKYDIYTDRKKTSHFMFERTVGPEDLEDYFRSLIGDVFTDEKDVSETIEYLNDHGDEHLNADDHDIIVEVVSE